MLSKKLVRYGGKVSEVRRKTDVNLFAERGSVGSI